MGTLVSWCYPEPLLGNEGV